MGWGGPSDTSLIAGKSRKSLSGAELERLLGTLWGIFDAVVAEAGSNPDFTCRLSKIAEAAGRQGARRAPKLDPFAAYEQGWEMMLRAKLAPLNADQLADVIRDHKLDPADRTSNLSADKLRDWIVDAVEQGPRPA